MPRGMTWFLKDLTWANLDSFKHFLLIGLGFINGFALTFGRTQSDVVLQPRR